MKASIESLKQHIQKRKEAEKLSPTVSDVQDSRANHSLLPAFISRIYYQTIPKDQTGTPFTIRFRISAKKVSDSFWEVQGSTEYNKDLCSPSFSVCVKIPSLLGNTKIRIEALLLRESFSQTETCV